MFGACVPMVYGLQSCFLQASMVSRPAFRGESAVYRLRSALRDVSCVCPHQVAVQATPCVAWDLKAPANGAVNCLPSDVGGLRCLATCKEGFRCVS